MEQFFKLFDRLVEFSCTMIRSKTFPIQEKNNYFKILEMYLSIFIENNKKREKFNDTILINKIITELDKIYLIIDALKDDNFLFKINQTVVNEIGIKNSVNFLGILLDKLDK